MSETENQVTEEGQPEKKTRRRRVAAVEGAPAASEAVSEAAAGEAPVKKPARRGRPPKAKASESSVDAAERAALEAQQAAILAAVMAERAAAVPSEKAVKAAVSASPDVASVDAASDAEAPKKRRTRKAKPADDAASEAPAASEAAVAAEASATAEGGKAADGAAEKPEKPAKKRTAKKPAKQESADSAAPAAAEAAAPAVEAAPAAPAAEAPSAEVAPAAPAAAEAPADGQQSSEGSSDEGQQREGRRQRRRERQQLNSKDGQTKDGQVKDGQAKDSKDGGNNQSGNQNNGQGNGQSNKDRHKNRRERRNRDKNREIVPSVTREDLEALKVAELRAKAAELELDAAGMKKAELVEAVLQASIKAEGFCEVTGVLDIMPDGYGFLRVSGYLPGEGDAYVGASLIRRNNLRKGDLISGQTRPTRDNEKYAAIQKIMSVNGRPLEECAKRVKFADLTPVYPDERLLMEHGKNTISARVIDLTAPIGKGQRGLIVSPPKAGKTTVLKDIAAAIAANNPEVHLMCLLVDERPEEVTDMQRSIRGEVISSTFDMPSENHIAVAELVIERAKRLVENGEDVVILLDSITRLARAYNLAQPASGRVLSGGVDSAALYPPKKFLGAARNIENGGSLTILASALVETGSKMDEVIFEEFKGTGNMELRLDRSLADRRIFPAIDPVTSGTRKEELLLDMQEAPLIWAVRRLLANMNSTERAMDMLVKSLKQTNTNQEFLMRTAKKAQQSRGSDTFDL